MKWIDAIPMLPLVVIAILLGLAPFSPEPHLIEKIKLLLNGALTKPIDIFDLVLHASPLVLLVLKLLRLGNKPSAPE